MLKLPNLTSGQSKGLLMLLGTALSVLGMFFPEYALHLDKVAVLLGGTSIGVLIRGPGHVSVTTHPDDLQ